MKNVYTQITQRWPMFVLLLGLFIIVVVIAVVIALGDALGPQRYNEIINLPRYQDSYQIHEYFQDDTLIDSTGTYGWNVANGRAELVESRGVLRTECIQLSDPEQFFTFTEFTFLHVEEVAHLDIQYTSCLGDQPIVSFPQSGEVLDTISEPVNQREGITPFIHHQQLRTFVAGGIRLTITAEAQSHLINVLSNNFGINSLKLFGDHTRFIEVTSTIASENVAKPGQTITVETRVQTQDVLFDFVEFSMQTGIANNGEILASEAGKEYFSYLCPQADLRPALSSQIADFRNCESILTPHENDDEDSKKYTPSTRSNRYQDVVFQSASPWLGRVFPTQKKNDRQRDIIWDIQSLEGRQDQTIYTNFTVPVGYPDASEIQFKSEIRFARSGFEQVLDTSVTDTVTVQSDAFVQVEAYDRYQNLLPATDNQWTIFFLDNNQRENLTDHQADVEDFLFRIRVDEGSCYPRFRGLSTQKLLDDANFGPDSDFVLDPENIYEIIDKPVHGTVLDPDEYIYMYIHRWSWDNLFKGILFEYDVPDDSVCPLGSEMVITGEAFFVPEESMSVEEIIQQEEGLMSFESIFHPIEHELCPYQNFPSRDVVRINQQTFKPDLAYWPEWRIGREAHCIFVNDEVDTVDAPGSVGWGESVLSVYWLNENMRTNTQLIDWYYVLNEIPAGASYWGTHHDLSIEIDDSSFHPLRDKTADQNFEVEVFKADLNSPNTLLMDDPNFNHDDPTQSGWFLVDLDTAPLQSDTFNLTDSTQAMVYDSNHRYAVLARAKDVLLAWEQDFFIPNFIMQVCDGTYCDAPDEGTEISFNSMQAYSLVEGVCRYCGQSNFGTVRVENKVWPKIHIDQQTVQTFSGGEVVTTITPENGIFASQRASGEIEIDISNLAPYLAGDAESSVVVTVDCPGCQDIDSCDITDIPVQYTSSSVVVLLEDGYNNCSIPRGYGRRISGNACQDNWYQNFVITVRFSFGENIPTARVATPVYFHSNNVQSEDAWPVENYQKNIDFQLFS